MITAIPLNKLIPSSRNVRRASDDQADLELKADIEARGLLQNLVVSAAKKGRFSVEAGGRRLRALQGLAADGRIASTCPISCLVIEGDAAGVQEASLAENFQRLNMNPADECLAFQSLIEQGSDVEGIARRFGLTARFVDGRLRLASLAPVVFEALGSGNISLDVAKAYAATPDRERQAYVFEQMSHGYGAAHPDSIRRMMTQATASATDRRAILVGEDAYLAAGGRIERDLFSDGSATRWLDVALLERLAIDKMDALAAEVAAETGLGWVRPTLERWVPHELTRGLSRVAAEPAPLSDAESAILDQLDAELDALSEKLEDEGISEEEFDQAEARIREINRQRVALLDKPPLLAEDAKAGTGAFLVLDDHGQVRLDRTYYSESTTDETDVVEGSVAVSAAPPGPKPNGGLSQRLVDELAMQRRDVLAVHVAGDPDLALDLAIFLMADRETGHSAAGNGSSLVALAPGDPVGGLATPEAPAAIAKAEAMDALDRSWTRGESSAERFDAFRALPGPARTAWLGHAVARTLEASLNLAGPRACAFHDHLGCLLGIDVARWWRPSGANYFDRVPKKIALGALAEIGGADFSARYSGLKKAELAQSCERIFGGEFIGEAEVKQAALAWVPEAMRFSATPPEPAPEASEAEAAGAAGNDGGDADAGPACAGAEPRVEEAA